MTIPPITRWPRLVSTPLTFDPVLYAALTTPGDYYLVVSGSGNTPDPLGGDVPFDPTASLGQTFSGFGYSTGEYVLNVSLQRDQTPPQVESVTPLDGGPPAEFTVTFSEPVNLQQLAFQNNSGQLGAVFIAGPGGQQYEPELVAYNPASNAATFALLDQLPPGAYTLHLSGVSPSGGITDLAGNPLVGNDPSGQTTDYLVPFTVTGSGPSGYIAEGTNSAAQPQNLGVLPAYELSQEVVISGSFPPSEPADYYQFQVLENCTYVFTLAASPTGTSLPAGNWVTLTDVTTGQTVPILLQGFLPLPDSQVNSDGLVRFWATLTPGDTYVVTVASWGGGPYTLHISNANEPEAPPPLTIGAAPAIQQRLLGPTPPTNNTPPPPPQSVGSGNPVTFGSPLINGGGVAGATFQVAVKGESGPLFVPPLSNVPAVLFLNLGANPAGGPSVLPPAPDPFEQFFSLPPGAAEHVGLLGPEDEGAEASLFWINKALPPAGATTLPPGMSGTLWRWFAGQLGVLWPLEIGTQTQPDDTGEQGEDDELDEGPSAAVENSAALPGPEVACALFAVLGGTLDLRQKRNDREPSYVG
jgi:hypothetical protein